jgi:hypothetical protein
MGSDVLLFPGEGTNQFSTLSNAYCRITYPGYKSDVRGSLFVVDAVGTPAAAVPAQ